MILSIAPGGSRARAAMPTRRLRGSRRRPAANFRRLPALGFTMRKTADLIIATYCIGHGRAPLHDERDFEPMRRRLGLMAAQAQGASGFRSRPEEQDGGEGGI